ncbi:N-acetylmuramoyl-L-alanine amidase family protein [Abyssisolibacter fermentans]|uniref:peptidoglycan recognition protein family protein n=1 Tax=Abyssisolibacter fermentans TaxID=1766203 RepID=UPI00083055B1|nr:N-acetylmuramoyl-L-alanine amidase [Abyssisolibacter fermentans]
MQIIQDFIDKRYNKMIPQYITIHETACYTKGANAKMWNGYLNRKNTDDKCWHFTVDSTSIYQHIPIDYNGWHAGDGLRGKGNRESIGIEMCVNKDGDYEKTLENTIWLCKKLIKENPSIMDVVQHNHWKSKKYPNGKDCPHVLRSTGRWNEFKNAIYEDKKHWAEVHYKNLINKGVKINEKRFNDNMTRGEVFALIDRIYKG